MLPLDNFDVVLGVNWLKTLGAIIWDFDNMTMTFNFNDQHVFLKGDTSSSQEVGHYLHAIIHRKDSSMELQNLLQEFASIFKEPQGLPPHRSCDHRLILEDNTKAMWYGLIDIRISRRMKLKGSVPP